MLGSLCSNTFVMGRLHIVQFRAHIPASDQETCREDKIVEGKGQASEQNNRAPTSRRAQICASCCKREGENRHAAPKAAYFPRPVPSTSSTDILERPSNRHARYQALHWEDSIMPPRKSWDWSSVESDSSIHASRSPEHRQRAGGRNPGNRM